MSTKKDNRIIQPYLFFDGRCEEAIAFYKRAIGAEVTRLLRFKENPDQAQASCAPPGSEEKIMHAQIRVGETIVMVSDGRCTGKPNFQGFGLSLTVETTADAETYFKALSDGGQVQMPLGKTFFSASFGMVIDKFGVCWMVLVRPTE